MPRIPPGQLHQIITRTWASALAAQAPTYSRFGKRYICCPLCPQRPGALWKETRPAGNALGTAAILRKALRLHLEAHHPPKEGA